MKTETLTINKSADRPEGVEVEVVCPENELERGVLAHLLAGFLRDARGNDRITYQLPDDIRLEYTRDGSFVVMGRPADAPADGMYVSRQPVAIVGIARFGKRFDVIHASLANKPQAQPAATGADADAANDAAVGEDRPRAADERISPAIEMTSAGPPQTDDEADDQNGDAKQD